MPSYFSAECYSHPTHGGDEHPYGTKGDWGLFECDEEGFESRGWQGWLLLEFEFEMLGVVDILWRTIHLCYLAFHLSGIPFQWRTRFIDEIEEDSHDDF